MTGASRKDKGSGTADVRIDSAKAVDGVGRKARMEGIKQQSDDGQVACVIDGLKPHRDRDKAVAAAAYSRAWNWSRT